MVLDMLPNRVSKKYKQLIAKLAKDALYILFVLPGISYVLTKVFPLKFFSCLIVLTTIALLAQLIHYKEDLPGQTDNPDGDELHPKYRLMIMLALIGCSIFGSSM